MEITSDSIQNHIPYYLTTKAKENLVKALSDFPKLKNYYTDQYKNEILQGDGWTSLELIHFEKAERKLVKGILLSNSCDISPDNKRDLIPNIIFSPIIKLKRYIELLDDHGISKEKIQSKVAAIKEQKVSTLFYLPEGAGLNEEYIARLDEVHTLPMTSFRGLSTKEKIFTLNQIGFYLFLFKLSVHFCRFHEEIIRD